MALSYQPGDDMVFQVESGFGLFRVLAAEGDGAERVWHVLVYEQFYPDVEMAEEALAEGGTLAAWTPHLALTDHALTKTPASRLGNRPVTERELAPVLDWRERGGPAHDRSLLLMLGIR